MHRILFTSWEFFLDLIVLWMDLLAPWLWSPKFSLTFHHNTSATRSLGNMPKNIPHLEHQDSNISLPNPAIYSFKTSEQRPLFSLQTFLTGTHHFQFTFLTSCPSLSPHLSNTSILSLFPFLGPAYIANSIIITTILLDHWKLFFNSSSRW